MHRNHRDVFKRILWGILPIAMALFFLIITIETIRASSYINFQRKSDEINDLYFPLVIAYRDSPAGSYYCLEYEFGLIWASEVITLENDGSSMYLYEPHNDLITGTWSYTPSIHEVGFTNFRWLTATYESPNRLWNRKYLDYAGFEIAISCTRQ